MPSTDDFLKALLVDALREAAPDVLREALADVLPDLVRVALLPPFLTRDELSSWTGWSRRKVDYMRKEGKIDYTKRGRTVLFPTSSVQAYLLEGLVKARESGA